MTSEHNEMKQIITLKENLSQEFKQTREDRINRFLEIDPIVKAREVIMGSNYIRGMRLKIEGTDSRDGKIDVGWANRLSAKNNCFLSGLDLKLQKVG